MENHCAACRARGMVRGSILVCPSLAANDREKGNLPFACDRLSVPALGGRPYLREGRDRDAGPAAGFHVEWPAGFLRRLEAERPGWHRLLVSPGATPIRRAVS